MIMRNLPLVLLLAALLSACATRDDPSRIRQVAQDGTLKVHPGLLGEPVPAALQTPQSLANGAHPDERIMGRGCLTCHAQIHGSNHPAGPRLHK